MADRLSQYPIGPNFGSGIMPQQHQMSHNIQQQQQPGMQQDSHHPMPGFPEQNPLWSQMQQMQQMRPQSDMNRNQMAELLRNQNLVRQQQQQQQQQFGLGMGGMNGGAVSGQQQQSFMDQPNQNQPHMGLGFPNMGGQNPSFQQSMHNRNTMLQTLQNNRQLELIGLAQNQQNQNGPINLVNRVQSQGGPNVPPTMNQTAHTDMFPSPAMNSNDAMRRRSPAHQMPGSQPQMNNPAQQPHPAMRFSREALQAKMQATREALAATDLSLSQLHNQRTTMNDAVYLTKLRQLQATKINQTQMIEKMAQALSSMNNMNMQHNFSQPNGGQTNSWMANNSTQPPFGSGPTNHLQPNPQPSPSQPHQNPHPPRTGPNQQLGPPFHNQPNFSFNRANNPQQTPNNGAGAANLSIASSQGSVPMMSFNIPPLEKPRFDTSFKTWCQQKSISIDQRMLSIDGRPIDLYSLHSSVIREGGLGNVQSKDSWAAIGGRLGFVQFPGSGLSDPPKSGPVIATQLAHVYKEYLAAFDAVYIASVENRRKQQLINIQRGTGSGLPGAPGGFSPKNWNPGQLRVILNCADKSPEQLRTQGLPEAAIQFIETHRTQLQQMIADQSTFRDIIRPNPGQGSSFDANAMGGNRPPMGQFPTSQPGPNQPHGNTDTASQFPIQQNPHFPMKSTEHQQQPPPHNGFGPPRLSRELLGAAHASISRIKAEILRAVSMMPNVEVPTEQRMEYNDLLERVRRQAGEFESKLHIYYAMTKNEEHIKKLVHCIVIIQQQRDMLSWSTPRLVLSMDMLRQSHLQISSAAEQLNIALSRMMNPNGGSNPNPPNTMPPRPPQGFQPQQQESSSSPQVAPAPSPSQPIIRQPPVLNPPPANRIKPSPSAGPSPIVPPTPTPPPATTPVATAATPTNTAASPQTPKSPKTKVRQKAAPKQRRPSVKSSPAAAPEPAQPSGPSIGTKRPLEVDTTSPSTSAAPVAGPGPSSNFASNEPSPPKRIKTEWDGEVSDELKKKTEAVENIKTDEDASSFFEQTMSQLIQMSGNDGQASLPSDISETLDMILKNYGEVPDPGPSSDLALDNGSAGPAIPLNEDLYFDFSTCPPAEDDESESKADTPDLISSFSTNPSPESGSETDASHLGSLSDSRLDDFSDPLRLGTLKEIDGGESAYYQTSDWRWDTPMPTVEQPWAIFN